MAERFRGGGINLDLNTRGRVKLLRPFGIWARIIADQSGGEQGSARVTTLGVVLSAHKFNEFFTTFDDNLVYLGDGSIETDAPFKIVSNNPTGWRSDMEWNTDFLTFRAADDAPIMVPMEPNPERSGSFRGIYSFTFYVMARSLSHPVPYAIPYSPFIRRWAPTTINQLTISRAVLDHQGGYELAGMHGTQTYIQD